MYTEAAMPWCRYGGQRATFGNQFSLLFFTRVSGIRLRLAGVISDIYLFHWATLLHISYINRDRSPTILVGEGRERADLMWHYLQCPPTRKGPFVEAVSYVAMWARPLLMLTWYFVSSSDLRHDELQCVLLHSDTVTAIHRHPSVENRENQL